MAEKAAQQPGLTDRERAMVAAVQRYWAVGRSSDERPNLEAFAEGWNQALQKYPGDSEIRSFAALAVLSTADPGDKSYRIQRQASAIAALVLKQVPNHPGANHYTIHAHDLPTLADQALGVARDYGRIAPSVPHALHMPSHIFTRLGLWEESVEMNSRSARAALQHPAGEAISLHYLHALDYLVYAYLQQGNPDAAAEVAAVMEGLEEPLQTHLASGYTLAAVPARIALEQQRWESAADVAVGSPERFPWQKFPAMEAISRFSRSSALPAVVRPPEPRRSCGAWSNWRLRPERPRRTGGSRWRSCGSQPWPGCCSARAIRRRPWWQCGRRRHLRPPLRSMR